MKLDRIIFEPKARIRFTREEVNALKRMSEGHYDWECKSLSIPGKGAIINGLVNSLTVSDLAECTCVFRDVDLLAKVCEQAGFYSTPENKWILETGIRLHNEFMEVLRKLNDAGSIVNGAGDLMEKVGKGNE